MGVRQYSQVWALGNSLRWAGKRGRAGSQHPQTAGWSTSPASNCSSFRNYRIQSGQISEAAMGAGRRHFRRYPPLAVLASAGAV